MAAQQRLQGLEGFRARGDLIAKSVVELDDVRNAAATFYQIYDGIDKA
jgi:hypothetical protein